MNAVFFESHLLAIAIEQIHVIVIAFVHLWYKQNSSGKSNQSRRQLTDSHEIIYLVTKLYTLFRTERSNTIHCPAAHPPIGHIREYPPGYYARTDEILSRGGRCLQGNLWCSPPASMKSRLASVTFKMESKVFIEETDKNYSFITEIPFRFVGFGDFKVAIVIEN